MKYSASIMVASLLLMGCSGESTSNGANESSSNSSGSPVGDAMSISEFSEEYWDTTACDSFQGCGDEVSGRFELESFKICTESSIGDAETMEEDLGAMCSEGVDVGITVDIEMEIEIQGTSCTGEAMAEANMVVAISSSCIAEAGGPALAQACPDLEAGLQESAPDTTCSVTGNYCACTMSMGEFTQGSCEDFVLESACLEGDTLTFSDAGTDSDPSVWTFTRISDDATASAEQAELATGLPLTAGPLKLAETVEKFPAQTSADVSGALADVVQGWR